jgi:hypothetical protein
MKRIFWLFVLASFYTGHLQAQDDVPGARLKLMKIAYITNLLQLTSEESQKFWPVYNQYEADQKKVRDKFRPNQDPALLSDQEVEKYIQDGFDLEEQIIKVRKEYVQKMKVVISIRKIALLSKAERNFNRTVLQNYLKNGNTPNRLRQK